MIEYTIINSAVNMVDPKPEHKTVLKTIHNAGFFSNCTIRLLDIVSFFNSNKKLPDEVDSSEQFLHYKSYPGENMIPVYFNEETNVVLQCEYPVNIRMDCMAIQFDSYRNIDFRNVLLFVKKYFEPSDIVKIILNDFEDKYKLDYPNLCSVFYRGNDKSREMEIAPYSLFIEKAKEVRSLNPDIKFLVQPDEVEFLEAFLIEFPDSIYFTETPYISKSDTSVFFELPLYERGLYGARFFAAVLALSKCKHVITHSGNGALWLSLYRGNAENINQCFKNKWI